MTKCLPVLLCIVIVGLGQAADVEHLTNGSFELGASPIPSPPAWGFWGSVADDWSFGTSGGADVIRTEGAGAGISPWWGRLADDDEIFVALSNPVSDTSWVEQQLSPLVIGESYAINFSATLGPGENNTSKIKVYIADTLVYEELLTRFGWYRTGVALPTLTYIANGVDGITPVFKIVHENVDTVSHKMCLDAVSVFGPENLDPNSTEINHVINGSFEIGNVIDAQGYNADDYASYWTYETDSIADTTPYRVIGGGTPFTKTASDGSVYIALRNNDVGGTVKTSWVEQDLLPLMIGEAYTVSFDYVLNPEADSGALSQLKVMIGDTVIFDAGAMRYGWYSSSLQYVANLSDGVTPKIKVMHINEDGLDHRMCFDNVSVYGPVNPYPNSCPGVILDGDLNEDCYVNLADLTIFMNEWLDCNDPDHISCN